MTADRHAMLAKVHVAKKQLALDDDSYRAVVKRITGRDSSGKASYGQLEQLLAEFTRLGFKASPAISGKPWVRKIHAIWKDLAPLLDGATDATLAAFVARQTKSQRNPQGIYKPEWLDAKEATKVIQGLEGWLARVTAARGESGMTIELDDYDRKILRDCPIRIDTQKGRRPTRIEAARMVRIKRMWQAGYVGGEVQSDGHALLVSIRDPGRLAIGRPAIETKATEATDAPAV